MQNTQQAARNGGEKFHRHLHLDNRLKPLDTGAFKAMQNRIRCSGHVALTGPDQVGRAEGMMRKYGVGKAASDKAAEYLMDGTFTSIVFYGGTRGGFAIGIARSGQKFSLGDFEDPLEEIAN